MTDLSLEELTSRLADSSITPVERAALLVARGRVLWQQGSHSKALSDYNEAADLDPSGPGAALASQAMEIFNFYNRDLYNP